MNIELKNDKRYFVPMRPIETIGFLSFTSSSSPEVLVECVVDESKYKIEDNYKIAMRAVDERFGREDFYQSYFKQLIYEGCIIEKTNGNQHVEFIKQVEWIDENVYLVHECQVIVG